MLFNEDQLAIRDLARRFAREKLAPQYQQLDKTGVLDRAVIREMGELGLMGVDLPESFGGLGAPGVTAGIIAEELAYGTGLFEGPSGRRRAVEDLIWALINSPEFVFED